MGDSSSSSDSEEDEGQKQLWAKIEVSLEEYHLSPFALVACKKWVKLMADRAILPSPPSPAYRMPSWAQHVSISPPNVSRAGPPWDKHCWRSLISLLSSLVLERWVCVMPVPLAKHSQATTSIWRG